MADPLTLHTAAVAALTAIPHVAVFDGDAPTSPPADTAGRVLPYLVVWASAGTETASAQPLSMTATATLTWQVGVTCAGGTPARVLQAAHLVRAALTGISMAGSSPLAEVSSPRPVGINRDATPPRYFTNLLYQATAP